MNCILCNITICFKSSSSRYILIFFLLLFLITLKLVGINNFGFGGANCHVLIKGNQNQKINNGTPFDDLPRLVCCSGRTREAVGDFCKFVVEKGLDAELIGLIHNIFR